MTISIRWMLAMVMPLMVTAAMAQEGPPPRAEGQSDGQRARDDRDRLPPPPLRENPPLGRDGNPPPRPGAPGARAGQLPSLAGPPRADAMQYIEAMRGYMGLVDNYARVSRDPSIAGIAALIRAKEVLEPLGADAAIDYFNKLLPEVKNEAIQRAIRAELADLYRKAGKQDKALEQLKIIMTSAPAVPASAPAAP